MSTGIDLHTRRTPFSGGSGTLPAGRLSVRATRLFAMCGIALGAGIGGALWAGVPAFFMTFNLLLLNEFPDEEADRGGGRRNLVLLFGRPAAARIYAAAALLVPASLVVAVALGALPRLALVAAIPSVLLASPLAWAIGDPGKPVPIPALGANVVWNLATNTVLALALVAATVLG